VGTIMFINKLDEHTWECPRCGQRETIPNLSPYEATVGDWPVCRCGHEFNLVLPQGLWKRMKAFTGEPRIIPLDTSSNP